MKERHEGRGLRCSLEWWSDNFPEKQVFEQVFQDRRNSTCNGPMQTMSLSCFRSNKQAYESGALWQDEMLDDEKCAETRSSSPLQAMAKISNSMLSAVEISVQH